VQRWRLHEREKRERGGGGGALGRGRGELLAQLCDPLPPGALLYIGGRGAP
jgi:hypothetical protein